MSHDDEQCLKLGREIVRMIRDVQKVSQGEPGYCKRRFTFPDGAVTVFIANNEDLAEVLDKAASRKYAVENAIPPSTLN